MENFKLKCQKIQSDIKAIGEHINSTQYSPTIK